MSKWFTSSYEAYLKLTSSNSKVLTCYFITYDTLRGFYMGIYKDDEGRYYEYDYRELSSKTDYKLIDEYEKIKLKVYLDKDNKIKGYVRMD